MNRVHRTTSMVLLGLSLPIAGCGDAGSPKLHPVRMICGSVAYAVPSPDGRRVAALTDEGLVIIEVEGGTFRVLVPKEPIVPPMAWSADGSAIAFRKTSAPSPDRVNVAELAAGKVVTLGPGGLHAWSPDGKRLAWTTIAERDRWLVVSDAVTGATLTRTVLRNVDLYASAKGKRPAGPADPARPETWRGPSQASLSADGKKVVYPTSADPRGWQYALGIYGPSAVDRKIELPGRVADMEVVWYPDSRRLICIATPNNMTHKTQQTYVVTVDGQIDPVTTEQRGAIRCLHLLDATRNLVLYCYNPQSPNGPYQLWVGELKGVK